MDINIASTTDKEIQDIINKITDKDNYTQVDEAYVEVETPFLINSGANNESWKNKTGIVLYPELLSYYHKSQGWITVPWICARIEFEDSLLYRDEVKLREFCKWIVEEFKSQGFKPFHDEDAFCGHFTKEDRKGYVRIKMYINPSYPDGYWSNHTL
jgi:hypothetical protein